jgi:hypothetical protein
VKTVTRLLLVALACSLLFALAFACGDDDPPSSEDSGVTGDDDSHDEDLPESDDDDASGDDDDDDDNDDSALEPQGELIVRPKQALVEVETSTAFSAYIVDEIGRWLPVQASWSVLPDAGAIDQAGTFTAGRGIGAFAGAVTAEYNDQVVSADVTVTTPRADFRFGFSHAVAPESIYVWTGATYEEKLDRMVADFAVVNAGWYRAYIIWKDVDPVIEEPELELADVTDGLVEAYAFDDPDKNWSKYDLLIDKADAAGIQLFLVIAAGFTWELPRVDNGLKGQVPALPDTIGFDNYIAQACLHARAAVRRYGGSVGVWVTEAELNMAGPTVLWGWRDGEAWWDWNFNTELLAALSDCVHQEDPDALVTMNFHTDIAWKGHVLQWAQYLDIISIDAFPNYFISDPVRGYVVGRRVGEALALGTGKPVVVQETSYPTGVSYFDFSEAKQAQYIQDGVRSSFEVGGSGYFHFKLSAAEELGGGPWYHEAESRYGLIRTDDTYKPGYFAYQEIIEELSAPAKLQH